MSVPIALSVAGSDPSGGAGIQADLKTFAAFEVYGAAVLTCCTAQNTTGVFATGELPVDLVAAQLDAVLEDLAVGAIKTGMLGRAAIVDVVAERLACRAIPLVVDPVMVATSGDLLLTADGVAALRGRLLPLARLVTPNLAEAAVLAGRDVRTLADMRAAARCIRDLGPGAVLVKGGHLAGAACDVLLDGADLHELATARVDAGPLHGSGCTLAAAICAALARGDALPDAVAAAKRFVHEAIRGALAVGRGARPLDHRVRVR
ncbi:MAG: bifunctional hydroxymethylpyrimidine kinase/phosphomethylpyrimidine kinase [Deltaproteobacteria bacterium]|nr:bifunctional hydroxymethylpyrimidine kinase/phosphomethylpyrimidine kinase [Deltaproteobacteria bacterium]